MSIAGDVKNPSQSGILNGTSKGECWISDDKMLGVTYSYPVGGCGVFGKIESNEKAEKLFHKVFSNLKALDIHEFEFSTEDAALQPEVRISLVEDTFMAIRNMVVNRRMVGK